MTEGGQSVSRAEFEENLQRKAGEAGFRGDTIPLVRPGLSWDFDDALRLVLARLIHQLPGNPWKGDGE